jgi:hypothetical protein
VFFFFLPLQFLTPIFSLPESETGQEMEDRYDREQLAENGSKCTMAMIRDFAEEVPANVESDGGSF